MIRTSFPLQKAGGILCLLFSSILLNYAFPYNEPFSYPLLCAALSCGIHPFLCASIFLLSSLLPFSPFALLSSAVQVSFLTLVFCVYRRCKKKSGAERYAFYLVALLPFVFLFPHTGYASVPLSPLWQKTILSALFLLTIPLFEGALNAILFHAFQRKLSAPATFCICVLWILVGLGLLRLAGNEVFTLVTLFVLFLALVTLKNASVFPLALLLSAPLCMVEKALAPCAEYALYSGACLLFCPYGRGAAAISFFLSFLCVQIFGGLFDASPLRAFFVLGSCALPLLVGVLLPKRVIDRLRTFLLFYRERILPRIAVNRNRRQVGEQLYEISALFREIESAFSAEEREDLSVLRMRETLCTTLCAKCPKRKKCENADVAHSLDKLIAVGCAKGRVNLIDLPPELTSLCANSAGVLFTLNKQLDDYRRYAKEMDEARAGRALLARQARGISDILRDVALEQSEEYTFSDCESQLFSSLAEEGILSNELFVYGEGDRLTVSMTVPETASGEKLTRACERVLGVPLSLAEKIPLQAGCACCILHKRPAFDAAFGISCHTKEGGQLSGDTHSLLRIDERRFLMALSDGMGSGEEARKISDHTLSLLEGFYKAKMPSDVILPTVNRLIAYSSEETFSCIDLCAVNLDTGIADVVKIGSPPAFLLSDELRVLEGDSLPIGVLDAVHPTTMQVGMKENDFLVFMSDGVSSAFASSADLYSYLSEQRPLNPQALSDRLLEEALNRYQGHAEDDMTVLTVRLLKAS